jgi:hypothetical protein
MTSPNGPGDDTLDLTLTRPRFPSTLEKWYVDVLLEDGTVVLVYLGRLRLLGASWARVTAEIFFPDGRVVRGSSAGAKPVGERGCVRFGGTFLEGERLRVSAGDLRGELRYRRRAGALRPRDPWLAVGSRQLTWSVEVPDADVEGHLAWSTGSLEVKGRGYRDRVYFDLLPWRFPIQRLVWGRAVAGDHAAFWLLTEAGRAMHPSYGNEALRHGWLDGRVAQTMGDPVPSGIELGRARTLVEAYVADLDGLRFGPARGFLRRMTGDPHERKLAAPCTILGVRGRAIHEVVTWQRP